MSLPGYDEMLAAQVDEHMSDPAQLCECCGKEMFDGVCYNCENL